MLLCKTLCWAGMENSNMAPLYCSGEHFKNTYELLTLRALKFSAVNKIHIFQCVDKIFCVEFQRVFCAEFQKAPFEIPLKISYPYIERYDFYTTSKF